MIDMPRRTAYDAYSPSPDAPSRARLLTRRSLEAWRIRHLADDVQLVATELVTNAVVVSKDLDESDVPCFWSIGFSLAVRGSRLVVSVSDRADGEPCMRTKEGDYEPGGRGLQIVNSLADKWGYVPQPEGGKIVWALVRVK